LRQHEVIFLNLNDVSNDGVGVSQENTFNRHVKGSVQEDEKECN
jgi:hypothetical protein